MVGVHPHWNARDPCGKPSNDTRLGHVRVHDVWRKVPKGRDEPTKCPEIGKRGDRAAETRNRDEPRITFGRREVISLARIRLTTNEGVANFSGGVGEKRFQNDRWPANVGAGDDVYDVDHA